MTIALILVALASSSASASDERLVSKFTSIARAKSIKLDRERTAVIGHAQGANEDVEGRQIADRERPR